MKILIVIYQAVVFEVMINWCNTSDGQYCMQRHKFDSKSFTCLYSLTQERVRWPIAAEKCLSIKGGAGKDIPGRLARVDSKELKTIVKLMGDEDKKGKGYMLWIGLVYKSNDSSYRWHGFPNEVADPEFYYFQQPKKDDPYTPYVFQAGKYWFQTNSDTRQYVACQYDALAATVDLTCPPSTGVKEDLTTSFTISGKHNYKSFDAIQWHRSGTTDAVATCSRQGDCRQKSSEYTAESTEDGAKLAVSLRKRPPIGDWWCQIIKRKDMNGPRRVFKETCKGVRVYAPPTDVKCEHTILYSSLVNVSCLIEKVFPEAMCDWAVQIGMNKWLQPITKKSLLERKHSSYTDHDNVYIKTECSVLIHLTSIHNQPVDKVKVVVRIYPDLEHLSTIPTAYNTNVILIHDMHNNQNETTKTVNVIRILLPIGITLIVVGLMFFRAKMIFRRSSKHHEINYTDNYVEVAEEG